MAEQTKSLHSHYPDNANTPDHSKDTTGASNSPHLTHLTPEEDDNFRIRSKIDILFILCKIKRKNMRVTLYFDTSNQFILTSILDIDDSTNEILIDRGVESKLNKLATESTQLIFITSLDGIPIEFTSDQIRPAKHNGQNVFAVKLPESLVRMQRRNHFRVPTPIIKPIKCFIPIPKQNSSVLAEITLINISCGGVGVIDHHPDINLDTGVTYHNCQIDLPGIGRIKTNLVVKNDYKLVLRDGKACKRAGCQFIDLPTEMEATIQRYITKQEQTRITP